MTPSNRWVFEIIKRDFLKYVFFIFIFFVYTHQLDNKYYGLFCDEAAIGFNAYTISHNLRDENNVLLPLFIENFGWYRTPTYIYLSALLIKLFGLSVFTTRLLAVLCGVGAILFLYLLSRKLFGETVGVFSAIFLAFTPGFFHLQRVAFELTTFCCFALAFFYFFMLAHERKSWLFSFMAFGCFVLAWDSYFPTRVFLLWLVFCGSLLYVVRQRREIGRVGKFFCFKYFFVFLPLVIIFVVVPEFIYFPKVVKSQHAGDVALVRQSPDRVNNDWIVNKLRQEHPKIYERFEHWPLVLKRGSIFFYRYLCNYSPRLLFFVGDYVARHIIPGKAPLPKIFMFLIPLGLIVSWMERNHWPYWMVLFAFLGIGLAPAFVTDGVGLTRLVHMYPVYALCAAIGVNAVTFLSRPDLLRKIFILSVLLCLCVSFFSYVKLYFGDEYHRMSDAEWYSYRDEMVRFIKDNHHKYTKVLFSGQIHQMYVYMLFYGVSFGDFDGEAFQRQKKYPYDAIHTQEVFYDPHISREYITTKYGKNILMLLNPQELRQFPSRLRYRSLNGGELAVFKEF